MICKLMPVALLGLTLCSQPENRYEAEREDQAETVSYVSGNGMISEVNLEGGFYGIIAQDGSRYNPASLPDSLREDSLAVYFEAKIRENVAGIHMWGKPVEIITIRRRRYR